jgi:hypothetical protein
MLNQPDLLGEQKRIKSTTVGKAGKRICLGICLCFLKVARSFSNSSEAWASLVSRDEDPRSRGAYSPSLIRTPPIPLHERCLFR